MYKYLPCSLGTLVFSYVHFLMFLACFLFFPVLSDAFNIFPAVSFPPFENPMEGLAASSASPVAELEQCLAESRASPARSSAIDNRITVLLSTISQSLEQAKGFCPLFAFSSMALACALGLCNAATCPVPCDQPCHNHFCVFQVLLCLLSLQPRAHCSDCMRYTRGNQPCLMLGEPCLILGVLCLFWFGLLGGMQFPGTGRFFSK